MGLIKTENLSNLAGILRVDVDLAYLGFEATIRVLGLKNLSLFLT
jgi:hypothetical protein